MELRKVDSIGKRNYAKMNEVSNKKLKSTFPNKWITSGILGIAAATYTSSNSGIFNIGVVFGCVTILEDGATVLTNLGETLANIGITSIIILIANGLLFIVRLLNYLKWKGQFENEEKIKKSLKIHFGSVILIILLLLSIFTYEKLNPDKISYIYHADTELTDSITKSI